MPKCEIVKVPIKNMVTINFMADPRELYNQLYIMLCSINKMLMYYIDKTYFDQSISYNRFVKDYIKSPPLSPILPQSVRCRYNLIVKNFPDLLSNINSLTNFALYLKRQQHGGHKHMLNFMYNTYYKLLDLLIYDFEEMERKHAHDYFKAHVVEELMAACWHPSRFAIWQYHCDL